MLEGGGESGDSIAVCQVANGVNVDLVVEGGPGGGEGGQSAGVDEETAGAGGAVGVWFDQSRAPGTKGAVWRMCVSIIHL